MKTYLGLLAIGGLLAVAAPAAPANAAVANAPGIATAVQGGESVVTDVQWRRRGRYVRGPRFVGPRYMGPRRAYGPRPYRRFR